MRRSLALGFAVSLMLAGGACANTFDATKLGVPVTMASAAGEAPTGSHFSVTSRAIYGAWGLVKLHEPSLERSLAAQLADGRGVADLKIRVRSRWTDVLLSAVSLGLIVPRSVTFEGVVTEK